MSNHTTTIDIKTIKSLLDEIEFYRRGLTNLRKKLLQALPDKFIKYGSDLWWEKSEFEADEDIKHGRVSKTYTDVEELITDLHKGVLRKT